MQKKFFIGLVGLLVLSGCESYDIKSNLGLKKPAPDEFMVISNPPLSTPPEFKLQQPGTSPEVASPVTQIEQKNEVKSRKSLPEDENFLKEFERSHTKSQVQKTVDAELGQSKKAKGDRGVIRKTVAKLNEDNDPYINPVAEKQRLKENAESGKAINEGTVKMQSKSTLERIFN